MAIPQTDRPRRLFRIWGTVTDVAPGVLKIAGVSELAGVGNEIIVHKDGETVHGEVLSVSGDQVTALLFSACDIIRIGDVVQIEPEARVTIGDHWLGNIVNYRGDIVGSGASCSAAAQCQPQAEPDRPARPSATSSGRPPVHRPDGYRHVVAAVPGPENGPVCRVRGW